MDKCRGGLWLVLALGLFAAVAPPTLAQTPYVDAKGNPQSSPVLAIDLTGGSATTLKSGWYLCDEPLKYTGTITVSGDVNLILGDDCTMRVVGNDDSGINVSGTNILTIWAQSPPSNRISLTTRGHLMAWGGTSSAGIGGGWGEGGTITINGGAVDARGGDRGAGIGSSYGGTITINGGIVDARGGIFSAGIGGDSGSKRSEGSTITINGGMVNAYGGINGAAIGGAAITDNDGGNGGVITINGGTVNATGGGSGAGIGGGSRSTGSSITIHGGTVYATGGGGSAGIGSGSVSNHHDSSGMISITGGTVNATGGRYGAGIGGGMYSSSFGSIRITDNADVTANGGEEGAGIGGGTWSNGGTITIHGGMVNATGGFSGGAGIGGGYMSNGGSIRIMGDANVTAKGGNDEGISNYCNDNNHGGGAGIGGGGGAFSKNPAAASGTIVIATSGRVLADGGAGNPSCNLGTGAAIGQGGSYQRKAGAGIRLIPKPADTAVATGGDATFRVTVTTTGKPAPRIAYQWQQSTDGGKKWSPVTGATKATLNLSNVTAGMNNNLYRCEVTVTGVGENSSITYTTGYGQLEVR